MPLPRLRIVADAHAWGVADAFRHFPGFDTELRLVEHTQITHDLLQHADTLVARSSTRVDARLLAGTPVRFVGTATVGDDHVDKAWLAAHGIAFASAAGSSTGSVVEYAIAALLALHERGLIDLPRTRLGVVGVGRIGGRILEIARNLGITVLGNDPPRARAGDGGLAPIEALLAGCDVLSLHTPLSREGEDATHHLLDAGMLAAFKGRGIVNTGRGAVIDTEALADWLDGDPDRFAVLDCWEGEPAISRRLLAHPGMAIATPHIAGHSLDGKAANTRYIYEALCRFLGLPSAWDAVTRLPDPEPASLTLTCGGDEWSDLHRAVAQRYAIARDDAALKAMLAGDDAALAAAFRAQRRHYPVRRAWDMQATRLVGATPRLLELARAIGLTTL